MIGPSFSMLSSDSGGSSHDDSLLLVLRSPEGGVARSLKLCADGTVVELSADALSYFDSTRTVEIAAPTGGSLSIGELLRRGDIRILKGASLLRENARALRQAATDSGA
jgi:hypothetical protein